MKESLDEIALMINGLTAELSELGECVLAGSEKRGQALRDHFAGIALKSLLDDMLVEIKKDDINYLWDYNCETVAMLSFDIADAMMKKRVQLIKSSND